MHLEILFIILTVRYDWKMMFGLCKCCKIHVKSFIFYLMKFLTYTTFIFGPLDILFSPNHFTINVLLLNFKILNNYEWCN
jgi:hypothetical protein